MRNTFFQRVGRIAAGVALMTVCASCSSSVRLGQAVVSVVDGQACFSIPDKAETRGGIPFYEVTVVDYHGPGGHLERMQWSMAINPPGASVQIVPGKCIRYGTTLPGGVNGVLKPMEPYKVYSVELDARPEGSSLTSYVALFCLKPDSSGKLAAQAVDRTESVGDSRFDVCKKPG